MTSPIIDLAPLHIADMTADQLSRFSAACGLYRDAGEPAPIDNEGFVLFDDVTLHVLGFDIALDPHRR